MLEALECLLVLEEDDLRRCLSAQLDSEGQLDQRRVSDQPLVTEDLAHPPGASEHGASLA
ncbi:hypothetical protein [Myxococcus sp. CA005]|uniref:hypothetical protein n=1 Tax=Myxococcus sp. CA005 TaxID=2562800 RepID=UPI0003632D0D|nr:hypothetical protein [Myxococcus sp. CA005]NOJ55281.1 hypothetical protein [Myxococcus xanthus]